MLCLSVSEGGRTASVARPLSCCYFNTFYMMQNAMIEAIKKSGIHVLNSGIR